jgi:5-methylthioadenosine/S-adenosylhomocysteine deaminase
VSRAHPLYWSLPQPGDETVMVDGCIVMENRVIRTFDVNDLMSEVRAMTRSLRERDADLFDVAHDVANFVL